MTRRQLFSLLITTTLVTAGGFLFWATELAVASKPDVQVAAVLGSSTSASAQRTELQPYPVVTAPEPFINARRYALYHVQSGKVLTEQDSDIAVPIASTTKLMTALVTIENEPNLDAPVTISPEAARQIGSTMELLQGEIITVRELLYGIALVSGNDAALALSEHIGGKLLRDPAASSEQKTSRFVEEMNTRAASLHMLSTQYKDPAGLDDTGRSSALDLAKLTAVTSTFELLRTITSTPTRVSRNIAGTIAHDLRNSNRLVADYFYEGASTGKTGFTPDAGHCLVGSATRNGVTLVAVVLSTYDETKEASAVETRKLLDWGFSSLRFE